MMSIYRRRLRTRRKYPRANTMNGRISTVTMNSNDLRWGEGNCPWMGCAGLDGDEIGLFTEPIDCIEKEVPVAGQVVIVVVGKVRISEDGHTSFCWSAFCPLHPVLYRSLGLVATAARGIGPAWSWVSSKDTPG